eukprot:1006605_1
MWLWKLIALSIISHSNATQRSNVSFALCNELWNRMLSYFPTSNQSRFRLINAQFKGCVESINTDVIAALQYLETVQPNDTQQMDQLRLFNSKYQFNEFWLLHYLRILKRNHYISLLNHSIIHDILRLPTWNQINGWNQTYADDKISDLERGLIKLSWDMFIVYSFNDVAFNGYQMLYQLLWRRIDSLPHIFELNQNAFKHDLNRLKEHHLIIWHYQTSVSVHHQNKSIMFMTGATWIMNNLLSLNRTLYQSIMAEFMLPFLMEEVRPVFYPASHGHMPHVMYHVLSYLIYHGQYDKIDLFLSRLNQAHSPNILFVLGHKWNSAMHGWLSGLNQNQTESFLDIMLKYTAMTFTQYERTVIARNLFTIMSEFGADDIFLQDLKQRVPVEVNKKKFLTELIALLTHYRFIPNQDIYLRDLKALSKQQELSRNQKIKDVGVKFTISVVFACFLFCIATFIFLGVSQVSQPTRFWSLLILNFPFYLNFAAFCHYAWILMRLIF